MFEITILIDFNYVFKQGLLQFKLHRFKGEANQNNHC